MPRDALLQEYADAGCVSLCDIISLAASKGSTSLMEVQVVLENSIRNMVNILKVSPTAAQYFQNHFGANAFAAAKACNIIRQGTKFKTDDVEQIEYWAWDAIQWMDSEAGFLEGLESWPPGAAIPALVGFLNYKDFAKKVTTSVNSREDLDNLLKLYNDQVTVQKAPVLVTMEAGWRWIAMGQHCSEIERKQMGHCGMDNRGEIVSLRDPNSNPHVTMTYEERPGRSGIIHQMRGKGNDIPDKKYWPRIKRFMTTLHCDLAYDADGVSPELKVYLEGQPDDIRESGRENSTAMLVLPAKIPGKNVSRLVRQLANGHSRLIVAAHGRELPPGKFELMLRASLPDCEKKLRIIDGMERLSEIISSAERNKHYRPSQALEVFCDEQMAMEFRHDVSSGRLDFDPSVIMLRPTEIPLDDQDDIRRSVRADDEASLHRVLDPHLFSNHGALVDFKNAVLQEGVLKEFLSDICSDRDQAIAILDAVLREELPELYSNLIYLGSGRNGSAYKASEGFVIKVTTDPIEAKAGLTLAGCEPTSLGKVYAVTQVDGMIWILFQEDLQPLPDHLRERFDMAVGVLDRLGALDALNKGDLQEAIRMLAAGGARNIRDVTHCLDVLKQFNVPSMCYELVDLGLTADFHSGNLMLRDGVPVLIDLGTPGDDPGELCEFGAAPPGIGSGSPAQMRSSNSSGWSSGRGVILKPERFVPDEDEEELEFDRGVEHISGIKF